MLGTQDIIDFVDGWRTANNIPTGQALTETQLAQFQHELNLKAGQMSYAPPSPNSTMILYGGEALPDGTPAWQLADKISVESGGKYYYVSNTTAGQLLKDKLFRLALIDALGDDVAVEKILHGNIPDPANPSGFIRNSSTSYGAELSLDDYISREFVARNASGNVLTITGGAPKRVSSLKLNLRL